MLEFLTEYEVEVAAAAFSIYLVKAVAPVNTHHADHRQEYAHTESGTSL